MKPESKERLRFIFSFACILSGFSLFATYAWSIRVASNFPIEGYWLGFALVSIPLLCDVFFWHSNPRLRLIYLVSFALIIHLQYVVVDSSPFIASEDGIFDYKLTAQITAFHQWIPGQAVERAVVYSFYPASNFIYAAVSMFTGIPLLLVVKYLFILKAFIVPPLIWKWYQHFFSESISYLGTAVLLASPGAVLFPHKEPLALIFFTVALYAIAKTAKTRHRGLLATSLIMTGVLIFTHHVTMYFFLGVLVSVFVAAHLVEDRTIIKPTSQFLLFSIIAFLAWVSFVAYAVALGQARLFASILSQIVSIPTVHGETLLQSSVLYEKVIIWAGVLVTAFSAGIGLLVYFRDRKLRSVDFAVTSILLIGFLAVTTPVRFIPGASGLGSILDASHRAYEFAYFAIGPLAAFSLLKLAERTKSSAFIKLILAALMVVVLVSAPMAGAMSPRNPTVEVAKTLTPSAISTDTWMVNFGGNTNIVGDFQIDYLVFVGYGDYPVHTYYGEREFAVYPQMFSDPTINITELADQGLTGPVFVVSYSLILEIHPSWNQTSIAKFDTSPSFQRVQSDGSFTVYLLSTKAA